MDVDAFTALLADRLAAIVPAGFGVRVGDGMLWCSTGEGSFPGQQGDYRVGRSGLGERPTMATCLHRRACLRISLVPVASAHGRRP